jgi:HK97 family phage major capsid protein
MVSDMSQGAPSFSLLTRPVFVNPDMSAPAANAYSLAYVDMSRLVGVRIVVGDSGGVLSDPDAVGVTVRTLMERFSDTLEVGYLAVARLDSRVLDTGAGVLVRNSAT